MEENNIDSEILYFIDRTSMPIPDLEVGLPSQSLDLSAQNLIPPPINPLLPMDNIHNTNNTNTNTSKPIQKDFSKTINIIKRKIKNNSKEYSFRPYCIDGVFCYIVLYLKKKIMTNACRSAHRELIYSSKMSRLLSRLLLHI